MHSVSPTISWQCSTFPHPCIVPQTGAPVLTPPASTDFAVGFPESDSQTSNSAASSSVLPGTSVASTPAVHDSALPAASVEVNTGSTSALFLDDDDNIQVYFISVLCAVDSQLMWCQFPSVHELVVEAASARAALTVPQTVLSLDTTMISATLEAQGQTVSAQPGVASRRPRSDSVEVRWLRYILQS